MTRLLPLAACLLLTACAAPRPPSTPTRSAAAAAVVPPHYAGAWVYWNSPTEPASNSLYTALEYSTDFTNWTVVYTNDYAYSNAVRVTRAGYYRAAHNCRFVYP